MLTVSEPRIVAPCRCKVSASARIESPFTASSIANTGRTLLLGDRLKRLAFMSRTCSHPQGGQNACSTPRNVDPPAHLNSYDSGFVVPSQDERWRLARCCGARDIVGARILVSLTSFEIGAAQASTPTSTGEWDITSSAIPGTAIFSIRSQTSARAPVSLTGCRSASCVMPVDRRIASVSGSNSAENSDRGTASLKV